MLLNLCSQTLLNFKNVIIMGTNMNIKIYIKKFALIAVVAILIMGVTGCGRYDSQSVDDEAELVYIENYTAKV
jgi:hypothetical protein